MFHGESFTIGTGNRAVLLIHGFTASTQEVEGLALELAECNFTVHAPLLSGHNTNFADFSRTSAVDYYGSVVEGYKRLDRYQSIDVVGLSFGGTLALRLARQCRVRRLVVLAPALFYSESLTKLSPWLALYKGRVMKKLKTNPETRVTSPWDLFKPEAIKERIAYPWLAFPQLHSTRLFMRQVMKELPQIANPILIIHSKKDTTTKPEGSQYLFNHIGSRDKKLVWLAQSGHVITVDYEQAEVTQQVLNFLVSN